MYTNAFLWFLFGLHVSFVNTEPVQFCKSGASEVPNAGIDFCMSMITRQNVSTKAHDMFISMSHMRSDASAIGWTAVALGRTMKGALMFILYGDPLNQDGPVISLRTATGHHHPTPLTAENMGNADVRVLHSSWERISSPIIAPEKSSYVGHAGIACYGCDLWPGVEINAKSTSQPWLWAWNGSTVFDEYVFDSHLKVHSKPVGNGGWGNFFVDMPRSFSDSEEPPTIDRNVPSIGAYEIASDLSASPAAWSIARLHGVIMGFAMLIAFPAGIMALRSSLKKNVQMHYIIQASGTLLLSMGAILGLLLRSKVDTFHQWVGLLALIAAPLQILLGWRHHLNFTRSQRRSWLSHMHIWFGRLILLFAITNVETGPIIAGWSKAARAGMLVIILADASLVIFWVLRRQAFEASSFWKSREDNTYFELVGHDDDDDEDEDTGEIDDKRRSD